MTKNYSFLPLLIDEKIYVLREAATESVHVEVDQSTKDDQLKEPLLHEPELQESKLVFQGKNNKQIIVLVDQPEVEFTTPEQELLLRNILSAINSNFNDIALINIAHYPGKINLASLRLIGCQQIIGFGVNNNKLELNISIVNNQLLSVDGIQLLFSFALKELQNDKDKKMILWRNIKAMFNL